MKKANLILSVISLFFTVTILVFVLYGWYVSNDNVDVTGINGSIIDKSNLVEDYEIYAFSDVSENGNNVTYTLEEFEEFRYNPDFDKTPSAILLKINFASPSVNLDRFEIEDTTAYFPGYSAQSTTGWIDSSSGLSLSSVIKFSLLSNVTFSGGTPNPNGGTVTFTKPVYDKFSFNDTTGLISQRSHSLINGKQTNVTSYCLIFDFDVDAFDRLSSNNIGNSVFENVEELSYTTDFRFQIEGSVVNN